MRAGDRGLDVRTLRRGGALGATVHEVDVRDLDVFTRHTLAAGDLHCDLRRRGSPDSLEADFADLN